MTDIQQRLAAALSGRYRIERALGAGGMATVYLAHDDKHDRKVAIKVLKPELAAVLGAERFVQEIKTTAALQHPHILPLFDSGEADGFLFYVMPYIQGETIRDKLNRETQFGIDEAVRITTEIADALDYAHRNGVIHRDIKPENLLLHDGRAMVMDFGIALAVSAAAGGRMTETGLSLGTPHYMSPEQATADKSITARSDVYSLASVLYEMLTGNPPHVGSSAQQIIMKIITEPVASVTTHRKTVPMNVASALARALEKLPADRFDSAKAFRDALMSGGFTYATTAANAGGSVAGAHTSRSGRIAFLAASVLAVLSLGAAAAGWMRTPPEPEFRRVDITFGKVAPIDGYDAVLSPDGRFIAVSGVSANETAIYLRQLGGDADFQKVPGTESGVQPAFSPDNEWIVFRRTSDRALVKVRVTGGGAVTLVPAGTFDPYYPEWGVDNRIVFSGPPGSGIVSAVGGDARSLPKVGGRRPFLLPDGSGIISSDSRGVLYYDFVQDSTRLLIPSGRNPVYVPTGHLLYSSLEDNGLFAVTFDLKTHSVSGEPFRVLERVGAGLNARGFSVAATGMLLQYDAAGTSAGATDHLVIIEPGRGVDTVRVPPNRMYHPRFSRDGRSLAFEVSESTRNGMTNIYTVDLVSGTYTQLTFEGDNDAPVWSPDGRRIAFDRRIDDAGNEVLCVKFADNSAAERCNPATVTDEIAAEAWLDDSTVLYAGWENASMSDIFSVVADSGRQPRRYAQTPFAEKDPRASPDQRLVAYVSNESGTEQLWMRDFPTPQGKWNLSRSPARAPRWSPDGRYVYFLRPGTPSDSVFRVKIERTPNLVVQQEEFVYALDVNGIWNWDLHPDGKRFVATIVATTAPVASTSSSATEAPSRHLLLENWFTELRRLMPATKK